MPTVRKALMQIPIGDKRFVPFHDDMGMAEVVGPGERDVYLTYQYCDGRGSPGPLPQMRRDFWAELSTTPTPAQIRAMLTRAEINLSRAASALKAEGRPNRAVEIETLAKRTCQQVWRLRSELALDQPKRKKK